LSREIDKPRPPIFTGTSTNPKTRDNIKKTHERNYQKTNAYKHYVNKFK